MASENEMPDVEVRYEDQMNINEFGKLNNRLHEVQSDLKVVKERLETLEDATTELMMGGDTVRLKMGEAFFDCSEEYATEYCERHQTTLGAQLEALTAEEAKILARQKHLKTQLYGRFGKAINLEE
eukprot:CAMPEP_0172588624 /NCGR_PEP_ID=MMETSP1068-20121228/7503_1 /TAXON_ID=35684 /ORGANISM="Pseudopedinella elastica, Strain CCMP716" /LENGTH=125 /DNA_ID=CAMNT_0013384009 /DNA_START=49 /DNA_END=426 /DNA_ORIENTATION=+